MAELMLYSDGVAALTGVIVDVSVSSYPMGELILFLRVGVFPPCWSVDYVVTVLSGGILLFFLVIVFASWTFPDVHVQLEGGCWDGSRGLNPIPVY